MTIDEAKKILKLNEPFTRKIVQQSFRKMVMLYHPDRFPIFSQKAWATHRFIKIVDAREIILQSLKFEETNHYNTHQGKNYSSNNNSTFGN